MTRTKRKRRITAASIFLQGVAITVPITLTLVVFYWLATTAEEFLGGVITTVFPSWPYWPGMGIVLAIAFIFVAGVLMNFWITRTVIVRIDRMLDRIPLVKSLYGAMRDIAFFVSRRDADSGFQKVVAVTLADDVRLVGFLTVTDVSKLPLKFRKSEALVGVYLPMSYQIGGYTVYLPSSRVEPLDMTVEDAMRLTLTAGMSRSRNQSGRLPD